MEGGAEHDDQVRQAHLVDGTLVVGKEGGRVKGMLRAYLYPIPDLKHEITSFKAVVTRVVEAVRHQSCMHKYTHTHTPTAATLTRLHMCEQPRPF